jgi:hypothetical protein
MCEEVAGAFELEIVAGIEEGGGVNVSIRVSGGSHGDQRRVCPEQAKARWAYTVSSIELSWDSVMESSSGNWKHDKKKKMCHLQHQFVRVKEGGPHTTASSWGAASCGAIDHGFALRMVCKADCGDIEQFVVEELKD